MAVGIYSRKQAKSVDGFVLGGRSVGPWLTAFAYGTSYFSAVVFVGYAGQFGWRYGLAATWAGLGNAFIGSLLAWNILGRRTRVMTQHLDAKTMPDFFGKRFGSTALKVAASVIVFTLWGTAEMGDLVRGALQSIPLHQYESGRAIGLTERQIFCYIIIPQTVKRLVPLSMNLITRMIKTTSLVVFVGVIEVVKIGQQIIEANRLTIPTASIAVYGLIFFMYFIVCWPLSLAADKIEKKQRG